jgi:putative endonuclease
MYYKYYYVYILTNQRHTVIYTGVTNDIARRAWEHREKPLKGFTKQYNVNKLVYYETFNDINTAIAREKQLKTWNREWKENLINKTNPDWHDLYKELS